MASDIKETGVGLLTVSVASILTAIPVSIRRLVLGPNKKLGSKKLLETISNLINAAKGCPNEVEIY